MANVISFGITPGTSTAGLGIDSNSRELEYVIKFDEAVDDTEEVLVIEQLPWPGYVYPYNDSLKCTSISVAPDANNHKIWRARAQFDSTGLAVQEGLAYDFKPGVNLVNVAAKGAYWASKTESKPNIYDLEETPIIVIENSAGDPFAEPLQTVQYNPVFTWWQIENQATGKLIDDGTIYDFLGSVNYDPLKICGRKIPEGAAIIKQIEPVVYYYRPPYSVVSEMRWKTQYTIEINATGTWVDKVLDQGYDAYLKRSESDSTLIKRPIRLADLPYNTSGSKVKNGDANDDYIQQPVKLDGAGLILGATADPVYVSYLVKKMVSWKTLNLAAEIARPDNTLLEG